MSPSGAALLLKTWDSWNPEPISRSADFETRFAKYRAPRVTLIPVTCAERDGQKLKAKKPVGVAIHETPDGSVAENENLQVFAYGETAEEALVDFRSQLFELFTHYQSLGPDEVVGDGERLRSLFLENFQLV